VTEVNGAPQLEQARVLLDITPAAGEPSPVRILAGPCLLAVLGVLAAPRPAAGQAAIASDLWRVAEGTLVVPAPLDEGGSAALWTPAVALPAAGPRVVVGVEAVHAPADVGMNGGIATLAIRLDHLGSLNLVYGRLGVDGLVRTETSPEGIGDIPVYAEVLSLGYARAVTPSLVAGVALRSLSGQLDAASRGQAAVDVGLRYARPVGLSLGVATRFFDPTLRQAAEAATYSVAAQYRTRPSALWGTTGALLFRYGATLMHGEGVQHLFSAGLALGGVVETDFGAARESAAGSASWRSKFGLSIAAGHYRLYLARDGGINAFGATYRFGLTAGMP
jgi:hypothetical protein